MGLDRPLAVKAVPAVFTPIAFIAVSLRCYVRARLVKNFGWDDTVMVISMLFYIMFSTCEIAGAVHGTGQLEKDLTWENIIIAKRYWWLCEVAYCWSSVGCKVSVCIFLLRITPNRIHRWILYSVSGATIACGIVFMMLMLLQCRPVSYFWDKHTQSGTCIDTTIIVVMTYIYSAVAATCDFTVGLLPIFLVKDLNMNRSAKIAVAAILGMACIASSAVIIRFPYVESFYDPEFLYATVGIACWSNAETGLGITAGSLATLRPLFRHLMASKTYSFSYGTKGTNLTGAERLKSHNGHSQNRSIALGSMHRGPDGKLRPDIVGNTTTITTNPVHGEDHSRSNSSERILMKEDPELGAGILRTFEVTTITSSEERMHPSERV